MLKAIDGKIVVPKRFMEWLEETEDISLIDNFHRISLIARVGWGYNLAVNLDLNLNTSLYDDLFHFTQSNRKELIQALLENHEFVVEQEKLFYMIAPKEFSEIGKYLNLDADENKYYMATRTNTNSSKTQFTQSEIDAMPQKFRDFFTQVEVEE